MATKFCFPLRIELNHRDYFLVVILLLHLLGVVVLVPWIGSGIFLVGLCVIVMSVRYFLIQQWTLQQYAGLVGADTGRWHLENDVGVGCAVSLEGVLFIGSLVLISMRRNGACCYWLTWRSVQREGQWHRLKVFSNFYL